MTANQNKWALVTGASPGGIGEAEVAAFLKRGVNVISTSVDTKNNLEPEKTSHGALLVTLHLDVTSAESISAAVQKVTHLTNGKLHYLINNAGFGYYYPLLDVSIPLAKNQFDVNVWGLLSVTQAFFPLLRATKGTVVNQASIAGIQNYNRPFMGIYSASKAAVMALSATMRVEFEPFDVRVVTLVTASVKTDFFRHRQGGDLLESSLYWPIRDEVDPMMSISKSPGKGVDRFEVADSTVLEVMKASPPLFIRRGFGGWTEWTYWLLPASWLDSRMIARSPIARLKQLLNDEVASQKHI